MLDLGVSHAWYSGFKENGAGGANLDVRSRDETYVTLTPALEIGGEIRRMDGTLVRPYVKLGVTQFLSGTSPEVTASFEGAPVGVAPFTVQGATDKSYTNVDIGLNVLYVKGAIVRLGYSGKFSDHAKSNGAALKLSIPF
jgi:uncharacterized protein with beta-barrel porin domain